VLKTWHIFIKEMLDGLRDRRSALVALLFMPVGLPLFLVLLINFALQINLSTANEKLDIHVAGASIAPNLMHFLEQNNLTVLNLDLDLDEQLIQDAVRAGSYDLVLIIPAAYAESFLNGRPANVRLIVDNSNSRAAKSIYRVRSVLHQYSQKTAMLRLQIQGLSPLVVHPLAIEEIDVASPGGRAFMFLLSIPYILFMLTLIGGMHMANDMNAGERERASLEPLLALPVGRDSIVTGKCMATLAFMLIALLMATITFVFGLRLLDLDSIGLPANTFSWLTGFSVGLVLLPFAVFGAVMFNLVASFTKSYKETQTFLTIALTIPILPVLLISMYSLQISRSLMLVPGLSQGLLVTAYIKEKVVAPDLILISAVSTLAISMALLILLIILYKQDKILR
jgi:sodium transport system permease protein